MVTANFDFNAGSNKAYMQHLLDGGADVLLLQEVKDFRVADLLPDGWGCYQNTSSSAKQGAAVAWRTAVVTPGKKTLTQCCGPAPDGGMQARWVPAVESNVGTLISAHAPPPRYSGMQPGFNANLQAIVQGHPDPVVGADANLDIDKFAKAIGPGMHAVGKQSGICLVTKAKLTAVSQDSWAEKQGASDHPAVWGTKG